MKKPDYTERYHDDPLPKAVWETIRIHRANRHIIQTRFAVDGVHWRVWSSETEDSFEINAAKVAYSEEYLK